jgi:hypothetical protein
VHTCPRVAAAAAAAARTLGQVCTAIIAELESSAPGFLSTRGMHSLLRTTAKQSAHLADLFERPAYPCNLRWRLMGEEKTKGGKLPPAMATSWPSSAAKVSLLSARGAGPPEDGETDEDTDEDAEDTESESESESESDAEEHGGGGLRSVISACRHSATEAAEALRTGAGRGGNSELYASEAISRATLVFCTLASAGQAVLSALPPPDALIVDEVGLYKLNSVPQLESAWFQPLNL